MGTRVSLYQEDVCMHLTNYAINKHSENFVRDGAVGSKRYHSPLCSLGP